MFSKLTFLLLTAILLVNSSVQKPMPDAAIELSKGEETVKAQDPSNTTSEADNKGPPLAAFLIDEFTEYTGLVLSKVRKILEEVVEDINAKAEKSEGLTAKTGELAEFVKKLDKTDLKDREKLRDNLRLLGELSLLVVPFRMDNNDDGLKIQASLKEHGMEEMVERSRADFFELYERFIVTADDYWNSLSPEQQAEEKEFDDWFKDLKTKSKSKKMLSMFTHVLEII